MILLADEEDDRALDDSPDFNENEIQFRVMGEPIPQGSIRAFITKSGRPILTHSNRNLKEWRQRIAHEGQAKRPPQWNMDNAILINIDFFMPRPKSLPKKVVEDIKRPDLDKLVRAVLDGLTSIYYNDDSQVVGIFASKKYAGKNVPPGVEIRIIPNPVRGDD
jgi:crossover junction endodeoxyribonuclease RusA